MVWAVANKVNAIDVHNQQRGDGRPQSTTWGWQATINNVGMAGTGDMIVFSNPIKLLFSF